MIGKRACAGLAEDKTKTPSEHMFEGARTSACACVTWEYERACVEVRADVYADQRPRLS